MEGTPKVKYEQPKLDVMKLAEIAKAFAVKSGMGGC